MIGWCADPEASWEHRPDNHPGQEDEAFYGYYLQAITTRQRRAMAHRSQNLRAVTAPELLRSRPARRARARPSTDAHRRHPHHRPARRLRLQLPRTRDMRALPIRALGIQLIQDLHPNDRGPHGTPPRRDLPQRQPRLPLPPHPHRSNSDHYTAPPPAEQTAVHDQQRPELTRYKLVDQPTRPRTATTV